MRRRSLPLVGLCLCLRLDHVSSSWNLRHSLLPLDDEEEVVAKKSYDDNNNKKKKGPFDRIPTLETVAEMANLSRWVYGYKDYQDNDECENWNNQTFTNDVKCHWYRHDAGLGTQVMIVSSQKKDYLAVVFAGTDDLKTSLVDVDVRKIDFGTGDYDSHAAKADTANVSTVPVAMPDDCEDCKVHAGFNNAVFSNHIFDDIYIRVEKLRHKFKRLYTTGHSLGAADSVLTALAMALQYRKHYSSPMEFPITSLNFGCPQVGNEEFQHYVNSQFLTHANGTDHNPYLQIWRFVLGWDLVPRLPEFFHHVGHTVQMHHPECNDGMTYCNYYNYYQDVNVTGKVTSSTAETTAITTATMVTEPIGQGKVVTSSSISYKPRDLQHSGGDNVNAKTGAEASYFTFPHWWPHHHHHHHDKKKNGSKDDKGNNDDDKKGGGNGNKKDDNDNITQSAKAYYHHTGNSTLQYAGVPTGWSSKPYLWVPGALWSHMISRYSDFFNDWLNVSAQTWVRDFIHEDDNGDDHSSSGDRLIDDDRYAEPPDDDAMAAIGPFHKTMSVVVTEHEEKVEAAVTTGFFERVHRKLATLLRQA